MVGLWQSPLAELPVPSNKFALDLFADPYNTTQGMSELGYVIAKLPGFSRAVINPLRIEVAGQSATEVAEVAAKLFAFLQSKQHKDHEPLALRRIGWNAEHEWSGLDENAIEWLGKQLRVSTGPDETILGLDLKFVVKSEEDAFQIRLQPRAGNNEAVFVNTNLDREWTGDELPTEAEIVEHLTKAASESKTRVEQLLWK